MTLSLADALTILGIVASFVGAVVVTANAVGAERTRINGLIKEVDTLKLERERAAAKAEAEATKLAVLEKGLLDHRANSNANEVRHQRNHEALQTTLGTLTEQVHAIALSNARIEAALKKEG